MLARKVLGFGGWLACLTFQSEIVHMVQGPADAYTGWGDAQSRFQDELYMFEQ